VIYSVYRRESEVDALLGEDEIVPAVNEYWIALKQKDLMAFGIGNVLETRDEGWRTIGKFEREMIGWTIGVWDKTLNIPCKWLQLCNINTFLGFAFWDGRIAPIMFSFSRVAG
jgi:hypothetical protein